MISFQNVSFTYAESGNGGVLDLNLVVRSGECVLLCGPSGCGKTTVTRLANGLIPHFFHGNLSGQVNVNGMDTRETEIAALSDAVGTVFQNPRTQFFNTDTDSEIVFGLENRGIPREALRSRLDELTEELHLSELRGRNIFELSGGEKQKIAFSSVYASAPDVLVFDEPSSNLDMKAIGELADLIQRAKISGKTILIAEHRIWYLMDIVDRVVYMQDGRIASDMEAAAFKALPEADIRRMGLRVRDLSVVKAFGLAERTGKAVDAAIEESKEANIVLEKAFSKMTALYQTVFKLARAAILVFAPYLLAGGSITPEKCLLLLVSSFMIYAAVEVAGSMSSIARAVEASLDRLDNIMDIPSLDENGADLVPENFNIEVKNMSFGYGEKEVLHQISLSVPQGSSCAIVGPSGAGKTTLVGLIARFWDVKEGQITLGDRDVREYTSGSLLKNFAIVFQNVYLFEDTVENNIRFGRPDASEDEIIAVAKKACCHDFIMTLPDGYQTKIGEGGSSLSGGEKQRISIARAILKDAPIVILDEATASVDPENEQELQKAIRELTKGKTILMIAHRLSTVRTADQIIVLENGRIVQRGNHKELMREDGLYRRFVGMRSQAIGWTLKGGKAHG